MSNRSVFDDLPPLRDIIASYDLNPTKALGQNFLFDQNITDKIVRQAGDISSSTVFEIGPGPGGLTRSLLRAGAKKVIAIEYDKRAVAALSGLVDVAAGKLDVLHQDALESDALSMVEGPKMVVANLPYNIATPLLVGWLKTIHKNPDTIDKMVLMFQKEVAMRITAPVNAKQYGRLGILSQWLCDVHLAFDLPPSVFIPPPKVTSSIVTFIPKKQLKIKPDFHDVESVTAAGFGQRRKMIRQSLKSYHAYFEQLGLDETLRAENLSVQQFIDLANVTKESKIDI